MLLAAQPVPSAWQVSGCWLTALHMCAFFVGPEGSVPPLSDCQSPHLSNTFLSLFYSHFTDGPERGGEAVAPRPPTPSPGLFPLPLAIVLSGVWARPVPGDSQWAVDARPSFLKMSSTGVLTIVVLGVPQPEPPPLSAPISGPAWELTLIVLGPH